MKMDLAYEKKLSAKLDSIYKNYIAIDKNSREDCIKDYQEVVTNIMNTLKSQDIFFKRIYTEIFYTGSFYDGLRVSEASEFDLDMVLKLPIATNEVKIDIRQIPPGFVRVNIAVEMKKLRQHADWTNVYRVMDKWVCKDGFIQEEEVRKWFEGILTKCLNMQNSWMDNKRNVYQVMLKKSGPAMTLQIKRSHGVQIDVDLVPVIQFDESKWPNLPVTQCTQRKKTWFIVPKKNRDTNKSIWRLAFPKQEQEILESKGLLKTTLKILKKLRDVQKWTFLSSYYIKTIFLWEVENQRSNPGFWNKSLGFIFLHMLERLQACLQKKRIEFYWHRNCNLLEPFSSVVIQNASARLSNIIKTLKTDVTLLESYLVTVEDQRRQQTILETTRNFGRMSLAPSTVSNQQPIQVANAANNQASSNCSVM